MAMTSYHIARLRHGEIFSLGEGLSSSRWGPSPDFSTSLFNTYLKVIRASTYISSSSSENSPLTLWSLTNKIEACYRWLREGLRRREAVGYLHCKVSQSIDEQPYYSILLEATTRLDFQEGFRRSALASSFAAPMQEQLGKFFFILFFQILSGPTWFVASEICSTCSPCCEWQTLEAKCEDAAVLWLLVTCSLTSENRRGRTF
jgi:hypothetical protein